MVYNFNAGPAILPQPVLAQARDELLDYAGRGMSILEMSHRSKEYEAINNEVEIRFKRLIGVSDGYRVLLLQGGASTQFALIPMNFLPVGQVADYLMTGVWSEKALEEASKLGAVHIAASTKAENYRRIPRPDEIHLSGHPVYIHVTTNNTIYGTEWHSIPESGGRPLIADMSSDILARPLDARKFAMIYAGAQKNLGPAGVTVVLIREDLLDTAPKTIPTIMRYATYAKNNSLYNTPPVFAVYMLNLVLKWLEDQGGVAAIGKLNQQKADVVYGAIDAYGGFYRGHADHDSRSLMNITFRLPEESLEKEFVTKATGEGLIGLAGHRSVGGIRASIYNAHPLAGCQTLVQFMAEFARVHG